MSQCHLAGACVLSVRTVKRAEAGSQVSDETRLAIDVVLGRPRPPFPFEIVYEERNGIVFATCPEIEGFFLAKKTREAVDEAVVPAMYDLLRAYRDVSSTRRSGDVPG